MTKSIPKIKIGGIKIFSGSKDDFIKINQSILFNNNKKSLIISSTSVHGIVESQYDANYQTILNKSYLLNPDGRPLSLLGKLRGHKKMEQIRGPDVLPEICKITAKSDNKHFFYGGNEGVADQLAESLKNDNPTINIVGTYCPPFRELSEKEMNEIADLINRSGADIVWVGLSTPKQEKWAYAIKDRISVKAIYTVGAAFDFEIGIVQPAPKWITKMYLEWLYRIIKDPKRLSMRYIKIIPKFFSIVIREFF